MFYELEKDDNYSDVWYSDDDTIIQNPTPIKIVPRPALRVGVIHTTAGKLCDYRRSGDHNIFL